jgi:hypothetical protein
MIGRWLRRLVFGWGISDVRAIACVPSHRCPASEFWRACADRANNDASRYANQIRALGHRPVHIDDGVTEP